MPLLAKTLRSTTFKLALISIGVFGAVVIALFGYVYWSTTTFVLSRSDSVIEAEQAITELKRYLRQVNPELDELLNASIADLDPDRS